MWRYCTDGPRRLLSALSLLLLLTTPATAQLCPTPPDPTALRQAMLTQVNAERAAAGLAALTPSRRLTLAAQGHACGLARREQLSHRGGLGSSLRLRLRRVGYPMALAGENLASGQETPAQAIAGWMNSPGHRTNLLMEGAEDFGLGMAIARDGRLVWVMIGARQR